MNTEWTWSVISCYKSVSATFTYSGSFFYLKIASYFLWAISLFHSLFLVFHQLNLHQRVHCIWVIWCVHTTYFKFATDICACMGMYVQCVSYMYCSCMTIVWIYSGTRSISILVTSTIDQLKHNYLLNSCSATLYSDFLNYLF